MCRSPISSERLLLSGSSTRSFDLDTPKPPVALQYLPQLPNGFPSGFDGDADLT
jgi:hypothetical protein